MFDSQVLAFTAVAAVLTITPGADTMLVLKNALRGGRRDGFATTAGVVSGVLVHGALSAVGLSVVLAKSAAAFQTVKLLGAGYLIWLGIRAILDARRGQGDAPSVATDRKGDGSWRASYAEGLLTNVLNPKVAVFYLAFLPQFISPGDPVLAKSMLLAGIHNLQGVIWLGGLTMVAVSGRRRLDRPAMRAWVSRASGAILIALGVRLALERR
jgi:RhtB (resistance to homoserine/threonine) family protein